MVPTNQGPESVEVLIAEDSPTQAEQLALLLQAHRYQVRIAKDGKQALEEIKQKRPTLVISDIMMPEMDGFSLCRAIKEDASLCTIPVILVTSLTSLHDVIKGLDCGADNFIRKPYEEKYLIGRIRFILANQALHGSERVQLGLKVNIGGRQYFVNTERQQIFDLLISTYEEAITMTEELNERQEIIAHSYQSLESLYRIAEGLNPALTESEVAQKALQRALELPGIIGGCISVIDEEQSSRMRLIATQDYPNAERCSEFLLGVGDVSDFSESLRATGATLAKMIVPEETNQDCRHIQIPLWVGHKLLGLMNLLCVDDIFHNDDDLKVFDTVGNHVAIALERAHLYMNLESLVKARTQALQAERNLLTTLINTASALVILLDPEGKVVRFNPACEQAFGWKSEEVENRNIRETILQRAEPRLVDIFQNIRPGMKPRQFQSRVDGKDGVARDILWSISVLASTPEGDEYIVATGLDVTDLRSAEERVRYLSNYDSLTGLPNRLLFRDRFLREIEQFKGEEYVIGIFAIYLSRLAMIGDTFGARVKDSVIQEAALRLKEFCGIGESVARLDDYSFAVVATHKNLDELAAKADNIIAVLDRPYHLDITELHIEPRVGITVYPNDGSEFETLVQSAEAAAHQWQGNNEPRRKFYTPELNKIATDRLKLEVSLRRAIEREEFTLHYQPQVDLSSGWIVGVEALIRWENPEYGLISPANFIPVAEETGLITLIGEWVVRTACKQAIEWRRQGLPRIPVAVNLSAKQLVPGLEKKIQSILEETALEAKYLELELTENSSMEDPESTIQLLKKLKDLGVCISIDDFGTGYSNLSYLKRFPVDKLKIDRSFVKEVTSEPDDLAIAKAVIALAKRLRMRVIAEGVETEGQLSLLAENGCDEIQGYLYSPPVTADRCAELLAQGIAMPVPKRKPYQRTLLLIDDEPNVVSAMMRLLSGHGYELLNAQSAEDAFELLAKHEVGVILCDQRMPKLSGTEFYSRVRYMYPEIVRMILSGYTDLKTLADAVNKGSIFKFLEKPWDKEEVMAAIEEAFHHYETGNVNRHRSE